MEISEKIKNEKGFNILEVMISVSIIIVGIISIMGLFAVIAKNASDNKIKIIAAYLAEENIEIVRQIRDTNWLNGVPNWDQAIGNGNVAAVVKDVSDIRKGFEIKNRNANTEKVYEDTANGGYFQVLPPGLIPGTWEETGFKRWMVVAKPDADTMEIVSLVYYNGEKAASIDAVLKDWDN